MCFGNQTWVTHKTQPVLSTAEPSLQLLTVVLAPLAGEMEGRVGPDYLSSRAERDGECRRPEKNHTGVKSLIKARTHFIASGGCLYLLGGRGGGKRAGEEMCRVGDSFGPIVIRHIGCIWVEALSGRAMLSHSYAEVTSQRQVAKLQSGSGDYSRLHSLPCHEYGGPTVPNRCVP